MVHNYDIQGNDYSSTHSNMPLYNVAVERIALLHTREVLDSNLGQETGYPDQRFSLFSSVTPTKCRDGILN
jgi:hypothetical protein